MTDWYDKTVQALQLNGKGEHTQEAYARSSACSPRSTVKPRTRSPNRRSGLFSPIFGILRAQTERRLLARIKTFQKCAYLPTAYSSKWKTTPSLSGQINPMSVKQKKPPKGFNPPGRLHCQIFGTPTSFPILYSWG